MGNACLVGSLVDCRCLNGAFFHVNRWKQPRTKTEERGGCGSSPEGDSGRSLSWDYKEAISL